MKNILKTAGASALILMFSLLGTTTIKAAPLPNWDTSGPWQITFSYLSTPYTHDLTLSQDSGGLLTGSGGYPAGGPYTYQWSLTSGSVSGDNINFMANYTAGADALSPLATMTVTGTIAPNGTMSGTWSDNYQGGNRTGTWSSTKGIATAINNSNVITNPATGITSSNAVLNGTNGNNNATGHSFWVSLSPFSTASPTIPSGVYSTPDMGAIAANTSFSASLSSLTTSGVPTNLPTITPNTTYYFAAWSNVGGTWYPGQVLSFTTSASSSGNGEGGGTTVGNEKEDSHENTQASNHENEGKNNHQSQSGNHQQGNQNNEGHNRGNRGQGNNGRDN